jgi:hypothetical protein
VDIKSLAHPAHPVVPEEEARERGQCSGCGTTTKTLTAPPQRGARLQGADVLPVVQSSLLHARYPIVLPGEDGYLIERP